MQRIPKVLANIQDNLAYHYNSSPLQDCSLSGS